ncbi:lactate racemase domain-containing protein [Aneurinibacillus sp. Ricciae_BoGa-3]|uniref:lactate racemase domain-containing protein n=1 Tax=Aneurinibacillus sp. Ricciae_BoGa-3 TaxID=3022697 RepID=UPI00234094D1|nr:lactate racemase domain-containing protein [Aneurinibacillus sp. Ricciae_BoGa-3]WCK54439.1 lactate racemase domain-containing protein [Aneurinibacillus sp. Ricciae_BoGa-3]
MSLPKIALIKQHFKGPVVSDIDAAMAEQLSAVNIEETIKPGMRVAITAGSRGIANIAVIIRAAVAELKKLGASPFIVPTMGSHGGATAEGQVEVLHSLGVTEEFCGAPVLSSMDVVQIGETPAGMPVYIDRNAHEADGILLMGRVKVHTDFKSPIHIESGLMKMAAIGLGKHKQALLIHSYGVHGIRDLMPEVAAVVLEKANVLCGVAITENAFEQTAKIEAVPTEKIREREAELLQESAALMPKLPVEDIDILLVDEIGKNYSGTGMDTNIIGRIRILGVKEPESPRIKYIVASNLSEESHGNALGIGLADLTTKRLFDVIDYQKMNENVITSSFLSRAAIPIVLENDRAAIQTALRSNWGVQPENARFIRIPDTLHLEYIYVSESLLPELRGLDHIEVVREPEEMVFNQDGYFAKWHVDEK